LPQRQPVQTERQKAHSHLWPSYTATESWWQANAMAKNTQGQTGLDHVRTSSLEPFKRSSIYASTILQLDWLFVFLLFGSVAANKHREKACRSIFFLLYRESDPLYKNVKNIKESANYNNFFCCIQLYSHKR